MTTKSLSIACGEILLPLTHYSTGFTKENKLHHHN
jgi:hypothetical protein